MVSPRRDADVFPPPPLQECISSESPTESCMLLCFAVPCPNLYVQLNALQLVVDARSLVWLNLFGLDLRQSLEQFMELYKLNDSQKPEEHVDVRVDGLMLKVKTAVFPEIHSSKFSLVQFLCF